MRRDQVLKDPVKAIDLDRALSVVELVEAYKDSSIQSRAVATCASALENALQDPSRPTVILGLSGALIAGGMRKIISDLIKTGVVDVIVTIGAIPYQDFYQAMGYKHWKCSPSIDDVGLRELFLDRIYDTIVDEEKFREVDEQIGRLAEEMEARPHSSREFLSYLGSKLDDEDSILRNAYLHNVPIFAPALNDSSIGIGLTHLYSRLRGTGKAHMSLDPIRDNYELAQVKIKSEKTAVIYIGGGVPKNYIQQTEVIAEMLGHDMGGHHYAIQITTDSPVWGGLSGCTFEEAQSWGKINKDARKAVAYVEATIGLSLISAYILQKGVWKGRERLDMQWEGDELKAIGRKPLE